MSELRKEWDRRVALEKVHLCWNMGKLSIREYNILKKLYASGGD